jgi:hypothetical protein
MNKHFTNDDVQMVNKHMKRFSGKLMKNHDKKHLLHLYAPE